MAEHNFAFNGGEILTDIGATWFVSYAYYEKIDKKENHWENVATVRLRLSRYERGRQYHLSWLNEILSMNPANLNRNTIGLSAAQTKAMAKELIVNWVNTNHRSLPTMNGIPFGPDNDVSLIHYDADIPDAEKITGLCSFLMGEYEGIVGFTRRLLSKFSEKEFPYIPVVLSMDTPTDVYRNTNDFISKEIKKAVDIYGKNLTQREILDILNQKDVVLNRFGEYLHCSDPCALMPNTFSFADGSIPCIIIYYKNSTCNDWDDYAAKIAQCLAHEYFHFVHDVIANITSRRSSISKNVTEGTADFFSILYLLYSQQTSQHKVIVSQNRYDWWEANFSSAIPYANALWFYYSCSKFDPFSSDYQQYGGHIEKFIAVLRKSITSMDNAYQLMQE